MTNVRIVAAVPLSEYLAERITDVDRSIELAYELSFFPSERVIGDHHGTPQHKRSTDDQRRFEDLIDSAEVLYGVPDGKPTQLGRTVRANSRLRWVNMQMAGGGSQVARCGFDQSDLDRVTFTTSAGVHAQMLAEFAILGIFAGAKRLWSLQADQTVHRWPAHRKPTQSVHGATLLIIGLGEIGKATAAAAAALGMRVIGTKRRVEDIAYVDAVFTNEHLAQIIGEADHIVITLPGTPHTDRLIDEALLARAKPGVNIINVGRGTVIDEPALVTALQSGHVGSAALDVFATEPLPKDSPLWDMPQVIVSPHSIALDDKEEERVVDLFVRNLRNYLAGDALINQVHPELGY